jgi:hypothetical protein
MSYFLIITWITHQGLAVHSIDFNSATTCYDAKTKIEASMKSLNMKPQSLECVKK